MRQPRERRAAAASFDRLKMRIRRRIAFSRKVTSCLMLSLSKHAPAAHRIEIGKPPQNTGVSTLTV